jgi:transposase
MLKETLFTMSRQELERIKVIEKVISGPLTQSAAAHMLGLGIRQVKRLCKAYRVQGEAGLISKQRGKAGNRRYTQAFKDEVIRVVKAQYCDFGPTFAAEKLLERQSITISHETLRCWMIEAGIWQPKRAHKARIHQSRSRRPRVGELVQIDGSHHDWFEGRADKCCLLVFIDDATSKIMCMHFNHAETTLGYFTAVETYINLYGKPIAWYSDKHNIFRVNIKDSPTTETQFSRAMEALRIETICANTPQAKGRVERANQTLQDRLIKEMRLRNISSIEEANRYLPEFIAAHNARFAKQPRDLEDAHRPNTYSAAELQRILSLQYERTISKNLEVTFGRNIYQITNVGQGYRMRHAKVSIIISQNNEVSIYYKDKALTFKVFEKSGIEAPIVDRKLVTALFDKCVPNPKKGHKPADNHPWKQAWSTAHHKSVSKRGTFLTCGEGDISNLR